MSESLSSSYSVNQPNSSESEQSSSARHFNVTEPVVAKRICFYKSGDPQFNGIKMVINNRSYKTFDALLDSLSKRVPLPFGVRNISTPKGRHSITSLEDLEDGKSYICSHQRKMKPINLEQASRKPLPWQISRPISARRRAVQLAKENEDGFGHRESKITTPKKMLVFKNGDVRLRRTVVLGKKNTQTFEALLDYMSELMQYPVVKLYTTDGRKIPNLQALILCSGAVVAAGREPFKPSNYESLGYSRPAKLLGIANRVYPKANAKSESENTRAEVISSSRSQIFSVSSGKGSSNDNNLNDNNSDSSYLPENHKGIGGTQTVNGEDLSVAQFEDDIEKSVHLNQDGSMTVEMKVRFKIKEEETIKWTTTVSRAGLSDEKNATICNSAMHAEGCLSNVDISECITQKDASFLDSYSKEGESLKQLHSEVSDKESEFDSKMDNICHKNNSADVDVSDVPEENMRPRFYRPPTPGPRRVRKKKAVVESVTLVSEKEVQEKTIGQFSYSEEIQSRENKSEYCMVAQASTKKSSVSNPGFSDMSDNDLLKLSSESIKEEMLLKVRHESHDLIRTTNRKTSDVPDEPELVQNVSEKSVLEQDTYKNLVSTCKANVSDLMPLSKIYKAARTVSADHIHELCDIKQIRRSLSSYITYSEFSQSKNEEIKCKTSDLLTFSQDSLHSACHGHCQMKMVAPPCSEAPTEKTNSTTGFFPTVNESENQSNVRSESVMASHLTGESLSASSLTKKKKKRKSLSNFLEQYIYKNQKDQEISGIIKSEGMHITSKATQVSATQTTDNCSDMLQKKRNELLVKNSDGSANSDKSIYPEDELHHPGISSGNKKRRANRQLTEVKLKSGKKNSSLLSSKSEDGLTTTDSRTETENSQGELNATKEGKHLTTNLFEQSRNSATISNAFSEVPNDHNVEKEKENVLENLSSKKEKKQKKKKNLSKSPNKLSMSDSAITLEALKQEYFKGDVAEHSLDNYVHSWLKNLSPNAVLPPINKKEGDVNNSDDCHFSKEKIDAFIDKEDRYVTNKVHMIEKKHLFEHNLTKKQLKPLFELEALEASTKPSSEKQTDSLTHDNTAVVEDAKSLLQLEFHHASELRLFCETHISDKKVSEVDIQDTSLCQRKKSEVAVQVDCTIANEKTGSDIQNNCMSSTLLHELQSTLLGLQKEHSGCIGKPCSLPDLSPPVFGSSSNLLLAWLLMLSLRENLIGTIKDDIQKATCSCSEILTQLQFLKQATILEKFDELKAAFSHFQQSSENNLLHAGRELRKQDVTHCHENMPISEIYNVLPLHEDEKSDEPCIAKESLNTEEALELSVDLESCSDIQEELCRVAEVSELSAARAELDNQFANTNLTKHSLPSAIELPEAIEEMAYNSHEKTQDKNIDGSFINEESDTSIEPNSTVHSVTSNDKNCVLDQDTSEIECEKGITHITTDNREVEKADPNLNDKKANNQLKQGTDTYVEYNHEFYSVQEGKEDTETCEETSERLSTNSPLSFCYESKHITEYDMSEGEEKLQVEEQENRMCSEPSQLKKCLKSPATSDWSDYRPDTEESDYNVRASSDLTNESGEEAILEKHYNTGFVQRTIERLYGKTEAAFKPDFQKGFPYISKVLQKNSEEFHSAVETNNTVISQEPRPLSADDFSHSSLQLKEFPEVINKDDTIWKRENISSPTEQPTPHREETYSINNYSGEFPKKHCHSMVHAKEDEGVLIDKGKWLLKENHLIRRSPPEQAGMYGNLDTTSTDTVLDANGDDAPYSHFGNLNQYPVLNEISSSEIEDMVRPSKNFCNYFNIPHSSDSDPLQDDTSTKSKPTFNGKTTSLPVGNKEKIITSATVCSTSTHFSTEVDTNFPAFTSVEFRLPDNKVHPLEQPLNDEPIQSQPTDVSNANRSALQEEDSLDKLHAICGQHCPILTVMETPINEEQRGYAYQKESDIENQLGLCLLTKNIEHLQWSSKNIVTNENNCVNMKNNLIHKIANNIFNRFNANNTLDFISNIRILMSSTLKNEINLETLHGVGDVTVNPMVISNCQDNVSKHIPSDHTVGTNNEPSNTKPKTCQALRINRNHLVGEKLSPMLEDPVENCQSEIFLKCGTYLNNIEHNVSENIKSEKVSPTEDEEEEKEV